MSEEINVQIYINKKEVPYSRQNMIKAINTFLPYLTNQDIGKLNDRIFALKDHRIQQEQQSIIDCQNIPIQSNRHDT
jgi:hypothetical protein